MKLTKAKRLNLLVGAAAGMGTFALASGGPFAAAPYALLAWLCYILLK